MTRDEQIEAAANAIYEPLHPAWSGNENQAFQQGAEWADANPENLTIQDTAEKYILELEQNLNIATEALETIANDKMKCKEFCLNWQGYQLYAQQALDKLKFDSVGRL